MRRGGRVKRQLTRKFCVMRSASVLRSTLTFLRAISMHDYEEEQTGKPHGRIKGEEEGGGGEEEEEEE